MMIEIEEVILDREKRERKIEELKKIYDNVKERIEDPYKKKQPEYSELPKCDRPYVLT